MRAVVLRKNKLISTEVADPIPGSGEVLVETAACGICGSDLHMLRHTRDFVETSKASENRSPGEAPPDAVRVTV